MSNMKKHTDVVSSMEEFTTNYETGLYVAPWVVYVGNDNDGYSVIYSNDENRSETNADPNIIESLANRVSRLETEKVYCYEDEYNTLIETGKAWVTDIDGTRKEVVFDDSKLYCIYEDEGPVMDETPDEEN